jgi:hypothetical protein
MWYRTLSIAYLPEAEIGRIPAVSAGKRTPLQAPPHQD